MQADHITLDKAIEWRVPLWRPAILWGIENGPKRLRNDHPKKELSGLEIGYNSGAMSCYLAQRYNFHMTGLEIYEHQKNKACDLAKSFNLSHKVDFRTLDADQTLQFQGQYDLVFLKSILFHIADEKTYREWLQWLKGLLKPGGKLVAIENAKGHLLTQLVRKYAYNSIARRKCDWLNNMLYSVDVEKMFKEHFNKCSLNYFGYLGQFLTSLPHICEKVVTWENKLMDLHADNCFIATIVAHNDPFDP